MSFPKENGQLYSLYGGHGQSSYLDATNYYVGSMPQLTVATSAVNVIKYRVPFDSWLRSIRWSWRGIPTNASENVTWTLLIYDQFNILKDSRPVAWFPLQQNWPASATSNAWDYFQEYKIPFKAGDQFIFLFNQTWVNNPTNVSMNIDCSFQIK